LLSVWKLLNSEQNVCDVVLEKKVVRKSFEKNDGMDRRGPISADKHSTKHFDTEVRPADAGIEPGYGIQTAAR
jgi:hypothetical protein